MFAYRYIKAGKRMAEEATGDAPGVSASTGESAGVEVGTGQGSHMDLDTVAHERYMERALELAREAGTRGDEPFGSLLVHENEIIMEERNAVNTARDVARHPELTLARRAERELSPTARSETVMYTSTEPCAMCAGGTYIAGLAGVVYSVSAERAAELTGGDWVVPSVEIFERGGRNVEVRGPVLPEAGARVHQECWPY